MAQAKSHSTPRRQRLRRPARNTRDLSGAYSAQVVGNTMLDRFADGEVVYAAPSRRAREGDDCVIQVASDDGRPMAWIKRFVSRDKKLLTVRQLRPKKTITFPASRVISVDPIVLFGAPSASN